MTFYLPASDDTAAATRLAVAGAPGDLDLGEGGGAPVDAPAPVQPEAGDFYDGRPGFGDRLSAQATVTRIQKDLNGRSGKIERDYIDELIEAVPPQYITDDRGDPRTTPEEQRHDWLLDAMRRAAEANPEQFGHLPTSIEDIDAAVVERRRAELDDAQAVLDAADGWFPELLGDLWAEASTPQGAMMLLAGAGGGARLVPTTLIEGGAAALDETRTMGDQYDVADDLGLPEPRPGLQIGTAFAVGAGLGGVMYGVAKGAERFLGYGRAADDIEAEQRPDEVSPVQHRRQMDQALDALARGDQAPAVDDGPFDWAPHLTGNAAIREDTVSGMVPEFRSGLEALIQSAPPRVRSGLQVYSGYRSPEVQAGIIADNMPKYGLTDRVGAWRADVAAMGPEAAGRKWRPLFRSKGLTRMVGMPGGSNHQKGSAADLKWNGIRLDRAPSDVRDWVHANAPQFGLHFPMGHEPWHIEPSGARAGSAPATGGQSFTGVTEAGPGFTVVNLPDGSTQRREGARNWRNNNPGNIEYGPFARAHGAVGSDGRFAVFPTYEAGRDAKAALLFDSDAYRSLTIAQAITRYAPPSENNTGAYIATVARAAGVSPDTPTASLSAAQRTAMLDAMEAHEGFAPGKVNGRQVPGSGRSSGSSAPAGEAPAYTGYTSRGYTGDGQVTAGDGQTVKVEYEVVDLSELTRASGDLQPRDRSRAASDEQVAEIAAGLDPARLMPSPEADRGAPIVGPDGMIESGNGRTMAIERAYERHADRAAAYRQQIETAGFPIPEGVERPVLIGRRTSELSEAERQAFVRGANQSQIARMSSTERAAVDARAIDAETVATFTPGFGLNAPENAAFIRAFLAKIPQAERAGLVDANGRINAEGQLRIKQAVFARAYDAPDLLARYTETDAGALKSLMEALELAAPEWAAMRAAVADGRLRPEMDITPFVLDAMRLIALARETAAREGGKTAQILDGMLAEIDLLEGAVPPLTVALVRKFMPGGKATRAETIADFLKRYATEAQKIGSTEASLFEAPGPLDALKAIDRDGFGDLTETGSARAPAAPAKDPLPREPRDPAQESALQDEADATAEAALRAGAEAGPFGPVIEGYENDPEGAIARLLQDRDGEVSNAFVHPDLGEIAFVYGNRNFGLNHIEAKHGKDMLARVPEILREGRFLGFGETGDRAYIQMPDAASAVIRLDFDGQEKTWLVTAFEDEQGQIARQMRTSNEPSARAPSRIPDATGRPKDSATPDPVQEALTALRAEAGAEIDMPDGTTWTVGEVLDDLDADEALATVVDLCGLKGTS